MSALHRLTLTRLMLISRTEAGVGLISVEYEAVALSAQLIFSAVSVGDYLLQLMFLLMLRQNSEPRHL